MPKSRSLIIGVLRRCINQMLRANRPSSILLRPKLTQRNMYQSRNYSPPVCQQFKAPHKARVLVLHLLGFPSFPVQCLCQPHPRQSHREDCLQLPHRLLTCKHKHKRRRRRSQLAEPSEDQRACRFAQILRRSSRPFATLLGRQTAEQCLSAE